MSVTLYISPVGDGQLGSIWSTIAAIGGAIAGPAAQAAHLPNWAVQAIGVGSQAAAGLLSRPPTNRCLTGRLSGDQDMTECRAYILGQLDQLANAVGQYPSIDILNTATQLAGAFSNDAYFDQAIGGNSRTVREAGKSEAAAKLQLITDRIAAIAPIQTNAAGVTPAASGPAVASVITPLGASVPIDTIAGIPTTTVLLVAVIGLGLIVITK